MPRYRFVGDFETVLHGLSHGVNAVLHRDGHEQPDGSTVVVQPGDELTVDERYRNRWLVNVDTGQHDLPETAETAADESSHPETPADTESPASDQVSAAVTPTSDTATEE